MADSDKQELISQFTSVTGIDEDRAKFFLESAAWDLQVAMASFYEDGDMPEEDLSGANPEAQDFSSVPPRTSSSKFTTFSNMSPQGEDSDEGQAFYAGGSVSSGQQILGPPKRKSDDVVEHLMKSAKEHGAEEAESSAAPSQKMKNKAAFKGTGYKLGDTEETPSEAVHGGTVDSGPRQVDVVLKLWKNGFSVDSSPLREYNDPANKAFLDSIAKGEVPTELIRMAKGGEVNLNMEDHRGEDFLQAKQSTRAFSGEGHMLGSPAPTVLSGTPSVGDSSQEVAAKQSVSVDNKKPTTSIQIRLADGSRKVLKLNHSHTISDIRNYIVTLCPQYASSSFVLMTTFPNKELTEEKVTLEDAKLLNAVIVQRIK